MYDPHLSVPAVVKLYGTGESSLSSVGFASKSARSIRESDGIASDISINLWPCCCAGVAAAWAPRVARAASTSEAPAAAAATASALQLATTGLGTSGGGVSVRTPGSVNNLF